MLPSFGLGRDGNGQAGFDPTQRQSAKRQSGIGAAAFTLRRLSGDIKTDIRN